MSTLALAPAACRARVRALVARAAPRRALAPRPRRGGPSVVRRRRDAPRAAVREPVPARDVDESARVQRDLAARLLAAQTGWVSSPPRRGADDATGDGSRPSTSGASRDESYSGDAVSSFLDATIPLSFIGCGGAPTSTFIARFENYTASNNAHNDSGGGWAAAGYGGWTRETVWTRRMVLTKEGVLIVLDSIQTSEQERGWLGGPLWQMSLGSNLTDVEPEGDCKPHS